MRFRIFDPLVSAEEGMPLCNLGHLFNAYAARLSSLEVSANPQETLRAYHRLAIGPLGQLPKADREKARVLRAAQERYYCLAVVNNSLHDMHLCVLGACNTLSDLFTRYDGDLHRFAIQERLRQIAADVPGTEEELAYFTPEEYAEYEAEWEPAGPGEPWRVKYKDDEQSLAPYTITAQLTHYFASLHEHEHIETIGSASPEDFAYFNDVVRDHSQAHKTSHLGELEVYRPNKATGQYELQDFAQRVENEVNDERSDKRVASYFSQILRRMHFVNVLAAMLTDAASCRELLTELVAIRDCTDLYEPATLA